MNKRVMIALRIAAIICLLMALGAIGSSVFSAIMMAIASVFFLPGVQVRFQKKNRGKLGLIISVVLVILALSLFDAQSARQQETGLTDGTLAAAGMSEE